MKFFNFSGDNVVIVNGRGVSGGKNVKSKKFDERKVEDCCNIDKITISSVIANVNVSVSNSSNIEAHFYGEANIDEDIKFHVKVLRREISIILEITGTCLNGNLNLDVTIPKTTFKVISVGSSSGNIILNEGVATEHINVKTMSGDLKTNATVSNVSVTSMSGDVELCIDAIQNVGVDVCTMSGDVSSKFNNIGCIRLSTKTMSGDVRNRHKTNDGYNANVNISTMSGDITIQ